MLGSLLLCIPSEKRQVENEGQPVAVYQKQKCHEAMYSRLGDNISVQAVAELDRVDIVTAENQSVMTPMRISRVSCGGRHRQRATGVVAYHSKSLYMMVKKTWRKRLTALTNTANR